MRLIKLAVLALFGYAIYEFVQGMIHEVEAQGGGGNRGGSNGRRGSARSFGALGQNISGPGEGTAQSTLERDGGSVRHKVGRGVVH
jgi:hypothetical protein